MREHGLGLGSEVIEPLCGLNGLETMRTLDQSR
jgi:hypothetical protein